MEDNNTRYIYMCVCVYVYVYIYTQTHTYIYIYIDIYIVDRILYGQSNLLQIGKAT